MNMKKIRDTNFKAHLCEFLNLVFQISPFGRAPKGASWLSHSSLLRHFLTRMAQARMNMKKIDRVLKDN